MATLGSRIKNLADWQQAKEDAKNIGWLTADIASYYTPLGIINAATGKTITDYAENAGIKTYQGDLGRKFATTSDVVGGAGRAMLPTILGATGASFGLPVGVGTSVGNLATTGGELATRNVTGASERLYKEEMDKSLKSGVSKMYRKGGVVRHSYVNIEKDELCVNPKTGEIVDEYEEAPKHPKKGKDKDGDRYIEIGMAIIPADKAKEYKKGDTKKRMAIISELPTEKDKDDKAADGYVPASAKSGATTALAGAISLIQAKKTKEEANRKLLELEKTPYATYSTQTEPELSAAYNRSLASARYGLSPEEQAAYQAQINRANLTRMQRATDIAGGNVSNVLRGLSNAQNAQQQLELAAKNEAIKRQKEQYSDTLGARIAAVRNQQRNLQTAFDQRKRMMIEQGYGQAYKTQQEAINQGNIDLATGALQTGLEVAPLLLGK